MKNMNPFVTKMTIIVFYSLELAFNFTASSYKRMCMTIIISKSKKKKMWCITSEEKKTVEIYHKNKWMIYFWCILKSRRNLCALDGAIIKNYYKYYIFSLKQFIRVFCFFMYIFLKLFFCYFCLSRVKFF
jgi:hypothetical protein